MMPSFRKVKAPVALLGPGETTPERFNSASRGAQGAKLTISFRLVSQQMFRRIGPKF